MDILKIKSILPHAYPFLLVDKVTKISEDEIYGIKNVTINEPFFVGHFPKRPIMPGVLIVESLAQVGAILLLNRDELKGKIALFTGIDKFKFRKPVIPGDVLELHVKLINFKFNIGKAEATAKIENKIIANGQISFAIEI